MSSSAPHPRPSLRGHIDAARRAGPALNALGLMARCRIAGECIGALCRDPDLPDALAQDCGLSRENAIWALSEAARVTTLPALEPLREHHPAGARGTRLAAVVLPGNVLAASLQGLLLPWLAGAPVVARAPSRGGAMSRAIAGAFRQHPQVPAESLHVLRLARGEDDWERILLPAADYVSLYGADESIVVLRGHAAAHARIASHGHGVSCSWLSAASLDADLPGEARRCAEDIAAYDQRGCLSPQTIFVEDADRVAPFAEALFEGLDALEGDRPRGPSSESDRHADARWKQVARALGELREGNAFAVSEEAQMRGSHGRRHVVVVPCKRDGLLAALAPVGPHLKQLGHGDVDDGVDLRRSLRALCPAVRCVNTGAMQRPNLCTFFDGRPPFEGLLEYP